MSRRLALLASSVALLLAGCATPSANTVPLAREQTVADQVLAFDSSKEAGADTSCRSRRIASTEVTLPFAPGSQGAAGHWTERWTVDRCGQPIPYLVSYMRAADGHLGVAILRVDGGDHALFPGTTIADRSLQRDAFMLIVQKDLSELEGGPCRGRRITHTEVVSPLEGRQVDEGKPVAGQWAERWTLDRCGTSIHYILHFVTSRSGTRFFTERETEGAPTAAPLEPQRSAAPSVERRELAPGPSATPPPQPAASAPKDSGDAIDWLLKPRTH